MAGFYDYLMRFSPEHREKLVKIAHIILCYEEAKRRGLLEQVSSVLASVISYFWKEKMRRNLEEKWFHDIVQKLANEYHMCRAEALAVSSIVGYVFSRAYTKEAYEHEIERVNDCECRVLWKGTCDVAMVYGILKRLGMVEVTELREICELYNVAAKEVAKFTLEVVGLPYIPDVVKERIERDLSGRGICIEKIFVKKIS
ncbi:MAG: hypothetical protein DRJ40_11140 [Thermoprotei archaeon]|nr:MAG: hypothetical protein DRJ40_11140 [Thermoprotei archaeon]